jgi:RNA polymerase sigma-70 factor (ECF subfamily)
MTGAGLERSPRLLRLVCVIEMDRTGASAAEAALDPRAPADERHSDFERLTQQRLARAYRLAGVLLRDEQEAQDAVHDATVRAWTRWKDLRDRDRFDAWFDRIVVNSCRDRLRRQASRRSARLHGSNEPHGLDHLERMTQREALRDALGALSMDHRIVVVLRFVEDLSVPEIAARTGSREGTVKSRLHYALRRLRAAFDEAQPTKGPDR